MAVKVRNLFFLVFLKGMLIAKEFGMILVARFKIVELINMSYLTDSYIVFNLKMESVTILRVKMM